METPPLLALQGVTLTLGGKPLLEGVDLSVSPGALAAPCRTQWLGQIF